MALWQGRSRRKITGGRLRHHRKKRKFEIGRERVEVSLGHERRKSVRRRGGTVTRVLLSGETANVTDPITHRSTRARIISVVENPANPHYVRRNIITKGAILETEVGRARVTSRPGQDGVINAVLIR